MTQSGPTPETDRSGRLALGRPILVALGLAVVLCMTALAGGVAGMPSGDADTQTTIQNTSNGTNLTYPPPNLNTTIEIYPSVSRVEIHSWYILRTMTERRHYRNKTGNVTWFKTDDALRHAFRTRGEHLSREKVKIFASDLSKPFQRESENHVDIEMTFSWNEGARANPHTAVSEASSGLDSAFSRNQSKLVLGPALSDYLPNGTHVKIKVPADTWIAENSTVLSWMPGAHGRTLSYHWTVNQTETEPRVVFNRSVLEPESTSESGPFGPAGGIVLSLLAVFLAVGLQSRF